MRIPIVDVEVWVPDWERAEFDNQKLPGDEQVKVHVKFPTTQSHGRMQDIKPIVTEKGGVTSTEIKIDYDADRIVKQCVTRIDNLEIINQDGEVKEIKTAEALLEAPQLDDLRDKIVAYIMNKRVETEGADLGNS